MRQWRPRRFRPPLTDMTPVWDFPQLVPTAQTWQKTTADPSEKMLSAKHLNFIPQWDVSLSDLSELSSTRRVWSQIRSSLQSAGVPGVCQNRSACFGHGHLLTYGILLRVKFKRDLSRPWHLGLRILSHFPDNPRRSSFASKWTGKCRSCCAYFL